MAGKTSKLHDIFHPSPVSLKELAAIAVSLEVWRCEMNKHRPDYKMSGFIPAADRISLECRPRNLPSVILKIIEEYLTVFGNSMGHWLVDHHKRVHFYYSHRNTVLRYFDDFVCDYAGKIDYVRTAKRMMSCGKFSERIKFDIACAYFFEDYIKKLWPSVSKNADENVRKRRLLGSRSGQTLLDGINYHERPHSYYWICRLTNQLNKIPIQENNTIDDEMFDQRIPRIGPSMTYFWDRIPTENRTRKAISVANSCPESAVRFILPKLDNQQLREFVDEEGDNLMHNLWKNVADYGENLLITTWSYIGNIMNESNFANLVVKMLEFDYNCDDNDARVYSNYLFREIWDSAPSDLKQSAMRNISPEMLEVAGFRSDEHSIDFDMDFLSIIAQCTSSEDKIAFLRNCCHLLITAVPLEGLQRFMRLCFENEDEVTRFKQNVMIENDQVQDYCVFYLRHCSFEFLNKFVNFCCPESQAASIFKQRLLQLAFLVENDGNDEDDEDNEDDEDEENEENGENGENREHFTISSVVLEPKKFIQFIDEAYNNNVDLSNDFKNQFLSFNQLQLCRLACCSKLISLERLIEFIDTFVPTGQNVVAIKLRMVDALREDYERNRDLYSTRWSTRSVHEVMGVLLPFL